MISFPSHRKLRQAINLTTVFCTEKTDFFINSMTALFLDKRAEYNQGKFFQNKCIQFL